MSGVSSETEVRNRRRGRGRPRGGEAAVRRSNDNCGGRAVVVSVRRRFRPPQYPTAALSPRRRQRDQLEQALRMEVVLA